MKKFLLCLVAVSFTAIFISSCASSKYGCPVNVNNSRKPFNK